MQISVNNKSLKELNAKELEQLEKEVELAIEDFQTRRKDEALVAAQKAAMALGFDLSELVTGTKSGSKAKTIHPPRFQNPDNKAETWTGKGRQPEWVKEQLSKGLTKDDMLIGAPAE